MRSGIESSNLLGFSIFQDFKVFATESIDEMSFLIVDAGVDLHQANLHLDDRRGFLTVSSKNERESNQQARKRL